MTICSMEINDKMQMQMQTDIYANNNYLLHKSYSNIIKILFE